MINVTRMEAADRIALFAAEGRLVQFSWHKRGEDGRQLACLLGAIHPDIDDPEDCPAFVMPDWSAHLLVYLFDSVRPELARQYGERFAGALRNGRLDDEVKRKFLLACVTEAVTAIRSVSGNPDYCPNSERICEQLITELSKPELDRHALSDLYRAADSEVRAVKIEMKAVVAEAAVAAKWAAGVWSLEKVGNNTLVITPATLAPMWAAAAVGRAATAEVYGEVADLADQAAPERLFDTLINAMHASAT